MFIENKGGHQNLPPGKSKCNIRGLIYFGTTKFEDDANRPFCFQQMQAVINP